MLKNKLTSLENESELISLGKTVVLAGGKEALKYFRRGQLKFSSKSDLSLDPVSIADKNAENVMRKIIMSHRPQDSILGEEGGFYKGSSAFTWVLDPIDGTRGFMAGQTSWTVLLSLNEGETPHFGIIYQPLNNELFVGSYHISELINNTGVHPLKVRKCKALASAISHTTDPKMGNEAENQIMSELRDQCLLSRFSLDAYAYGLLAMGCMDLIIESSMKFYDMQAPIALIKSAGGVVSDWDGGCNYDLGRIIACGDKRIHEEALSILATFTDY